MTMLYLIWQDKKNGDVSTETYKEWHSGESIKRLITQAGRYPDLLQADGHELAEIINILPSLATKEWCLVITQPWVNFVIENLKLRYNKE